ncbi:MAG: zinc-ribbon domain-containing protein [Desulfosalsimonadaceae bacterium]
MKIRCPQCDALHTIDAAKLPARSIRVKCKKCAHPFDISAHVQGPLQHEPLAEGALSPFPGKTRDDQPVDERNEAAVIKSLYDGIIRYVNQKKFKEADGLRHQLMKIAPMALSEIFSTGEIIEQKKMMAMDPERIKPWSSLYDRLNPSETVAFYFALTDVEAKANIPVFKQGEFDDKLYFVQSGHLKLSYYDTELGRHFPYGDLRQGDVAGADAFFSFSCHTSTLTPVVDSQISVLEKSVYQSLLFENSTLESKLCNFFGENIKTCDLSTQKGRARRMHKRYRVLLNAQVQMADPGGSRIIGKEIANVKLVDISAGGLCYMVRNLKVNDAEKLHKQWVRITMQYKKDHVFQEMKTLAQIVSLKFYPFEECSVHVRFKKPVDEKKVLEMVHFFELQG